MNEAERMFISALERLEIPYVYYKPAINQGVWCDVCGEENVDFIVNTVGKAFHSECIPIAEESLTDEQT